MELVEPSCEFIESYKSALNEFDQQQITGFWKIFGPIEDENNFIQTIKHYQHQCGLENSIVPASTYWLVDGGKFVGHVSIRHFLNAPLLRKGGHIGYAIRPSCHRKGYGLQILKLVLPQVRKLGIKDALLTCYQDNLGSRKIIEKNGGTLSDQIEIDGKIVLHYWIKL